MAEPTTRSVEITPDERAELDEIRTGLLGCGYAEIPEHRQLRLGVRVRHNSQQWPEAWTDGTGVVLLLTERLDSPWSSSWGMADVELVVLWDKPWPFESSSRLSQLAQYHVTVVQHQPEVQHG